MYSIRVKKLQSERCVERTLRTLFEMEFDKRETTCYSKSLIFKKKMFTLEKELNIGYTEHCPILSYTEVINF